MRYCIGLTSTTSNFLTILINLTDYRLDTAPFILTLTKEIHMTLFRTVKQLIAAHPTSDGDGVKISRVAGFQNSHFSPFLMLDELKSDQSKDYVGGFPPHPHRGIETLTYMKHGHFQHRDHMGNIGELRGGGAQWMAAGRGVIHSEMPIMTDGELHGFQLWINQPASQKMTPAKYKDFQPESIVEVPLHEQQNSPLRLLAGEIGVEGKTYQAALTDTAAEATVADWAPESEQSLQFEVPQSHNTLLFVYKGEMNMDNHTIKQGQLAVLSAGDAVALISAAIPSGVLILSGEPINEPVAHYGPFVMNTMQEIEQTIQDYNSGVFETY
jgi:redox-sensitive bicupin YhaK (pirin superfamily)